MTRNAVRRRRRRGFAVFTALIVLVLLSAALLSLGSVLVSDYRRTVHAERDAQLRQLLLAGAQLAHQRIIASQDAANATKIAVALPAPLTQDGASLSIEIQPTDAGSTVHVTARLRDQEQRQTLTYTRAASEWTVSSADLGPD